MIDKTSETAKLWNSGKRMDKVKKFKWNTETGVFGIDAMVDKWDIQIDASYQRSPSDARILEISRNWRWELIGRPVVGEREDGRLFIVDGQHRLLAARNRSDVAELPCVMFESSGSRQEAELFVLLNTGRGPMTILERFKALLITGDPVAVSIKQTTEELGLTIPEKKNSRRNKTGESDTISCIGSLMKAWQRDPENAAKCLCLAKSIAGRKAIIDRLFDGLFTLNKKLLTINDNVFNYADKLLDAGHGAIMDAISKQGLILGYGGENVYASGILSVINKKKRNRIVLDGAAA